jgi:hypothetical protein
MQAITVMVPPEGLTLLLKPRPGAKSSQAVVVASDDVEISPSASASPSRSAPTQDAQYIVERLRKLKVKTEAAAINSIKAMFQFTEQLTEQGAKKRLAEAQKKGLLKIDAAGRIAFRDA